ncbi:hypothetical protein V6Z12_A12G044200 [Gossypium hirsutum]
MLILLIFQNFQCLRFYTGYRTKQLLSSRNYVRLTDLSRFIQRSIKSCGGRFKGSQTIDESYGGACFSQRINEVPESDNITCVSWFAINQVYGWCFLKDATDLCRLLECDVRTL